MSRWAILSRLSDFGKIDKMHKKGTRRIPSPQAQPGRVFPLFLSARMNDVNRAVRLRLPVDAVRLSWYDRRPRRPCRASIKEG
jgi:hypothetical protein